MRIGRHNLSNAVFLAPMSGVSDLPFRRLVQRLGAGLVVSEMVASAELVRHSRRVVRRAQGGDLKPFVIQLVGCEAKWMAEGARIAEALGADIIDINMGCPAREVTGKLSGSALMRDLDEAACLIQAVVGAVTAPVSLKIRLGWDDANRNAPELARRAEAIGVQMVTVHARTRSQFFNGRADWSYVAQVRAAVAIPLIINGDICTTSDVRRALQASGADGVMVGRGAYGAPWLPGQLATYLMTGKDIRAPSLAEQSRIARAHVSAMLEFYGEELGLRNARKHIGWYLAKSGRDSAGVKDWRRRLCTNGCAAGVLDQLSEFYEETVQRHGSQVAA